MQRLKRVFHIDIKHCPVCGGTLRVIACIECPRPHRPNPRPSRRPRGRLRTPSTRLAAERALGRTLGLAITHHFLTPPTGAQQQRCASPLTPTGSYLPRHRSCTGPTLAGSKLLLDDREMSALGPVTDQFVSMPILLRQRRSVGCFTFPRSRSSWSPASASSASGRSPPRHPGATWCRWGFNTSRSRRGSRWSPLPPSLARCSATGCGTCSIRNRTSESCRYGPKPGRLLPAGSRSFLPESDGGRHRPRPPPMSVCSVRGDGMPRTGPRGA